MGPRACVLAPRAGTVEATQDGAWVLRGGGATQSGRDAAQARPFLSSLRPGSCSRRGEFLRVRVPSSSIRAVALLCRAGVLAGTRTPWSPSSQPVSPQPAGWGRSSGTPGRGRTRSGVRWRGRRSGASTCGGKRLVRERPPPAWVCPAPGPRLSGLSESGKRFALRRRRKRGPHARLPYRSHPENGPLVPRVPGAVAPASVSTLLPDTCCRGCDSGADVGRYDPFA